MGSKYEWHVLLDDADWAESTSLDNLLSDEKPGIDDSSDRARSHGRGWYAVLLLIGVGALSAGLYFWQQAQTGLTQIKTDVREAVAAETALRSNDTILLDSQAALEWQRALRARAEHSASQNISTTITSVDLLDDKAMVRLHTTSSTQPLPYRETRFYRQTAAGWLRTAPDAGFWGAKMSLESEYFVFQFRRRDRAAVVAAAPVLDKQFRQMHQLLGLILPARERDRQNKIRILIVPVAGAPVRLGQDGTVLRMPSPLLLPVPQPLSDEEVIAEGALHLLRQNAVEKTLHAQSEAEIFNEIYMDHGVQLWLAWEANTSLSTYQGGLVSWLYGDLPRGPAQLPEHFGEICQLLSVWQRPASHAGVPLICSMRMPALVPEYARPATRINQVRPSIAEYGVPIRPRGRFLTSAVQGQSLAVATMLAYIAQDFGDAAVPQVLALVAEGATWQQIAAEQFGMSANAFESGWHAYVMNEYGVDLASSVASSN